MSVHHLTPTERQRLLDLLRQGELSTTALAQRFGLSRVYVGQLRQRVAPRPTHSTAILRDLRLAADWD